MAGKKTFKELITGLNSESSSSIELLVRNTSSGDVKKISLANLIELLANVPSAKKITSKRKLWGQEFDGSYDISGKMSGVGDIDSVGTFIAQRGTYGGYFLFAGGVEGTSLSIERMNQAGSWQGLGITIRNNGNVGVNTNIPSHTLHVAGDIYATGTSTASAHETSSDIRLKSNIIDKEVNLIDIANAPVIDYTMKIETPIAKNEYVDSADVDEQTVSNKVRTTSADIKNAETVQEVEVTELQCTGSIAQYWKEILPNCVSEDKDGMLSMQYGNIALVSVISLAREVAALKETVKVLKEKVEE